MVYLQWLHKCIYDVTETFRYAFLPGLHCTALQRHGSSEAEKSVPDTLHRFTKVNPKLPNLRLCLLFSGPPRTSTRTQELVTGFDTKVLCAVLRPDWTP